MNIYKKTSTGWEENQDAFNLLANNSNYLTKKFSIEEVKKEEVKEEGWSSVSTIPYEFYCGGAILLNNEIHILGSGTSSYYKYHYKYNTSTNTWSSVSTLPYDFYRGSAIVLNNEIHILGSSKSNTSHYSISALLSISKLIEKKTTS